MLCDAGADTTHTRIYRRFIEPFKESNLRAYVYAPHDGQTSARRSGSLAHAPASPNISCSLEGLTSLLDRFGEEDGDQEDSTVSIRVAYGKRDLCPPPRLSTGKRYIIRGLSC